MNDQDAARIRILVQQFVRGFGLLEQSHTPCGAKLPISHAHALMELRRAPQITQNDLARMLMLTKSSVSRVVGKLESEGHLTRIRDKRDGRVSRLSLTSQGVRLAEDLESQGLARFQKLSACLPADSADEICRSLSLLVEAVALLPEDKP